MWKYSYHWIPVTSRMKLLTNQIFYGWMCSAGTIGGEYDRRQRCSKHETGGGESLWSSWEIRLQVVADSNIALSIKLYWRTSDGAERISFGELFKINELISSRFSCILESAKLNRSKGLKIWIVLKNNFCWRLLDYPGEKLSKDTDDKTVIQLVRRNR